MPNMFFADDSRQPTPTRDGVRPLISAGGVLVESQMVGPLESRLNRLCDDTGFPEGREGEFKWSPGRELWMRDNLVGTSREEFFMRALQEAFGHGVVAAVMISDTDCRTATSARDHQTDVTTMLLERVNTWLSYRNQDSLVVVDRPSGGRGDEDEFLADCLETLAEGTRYVSFDRVPINVLSTPSHLVRLLQLADIVTACTTAYVAGEDTYSPPVFRAIRPLLMDRDGNVGGVGLKIHPLMRYGNLYHWLADDNYYRRGNSGHVLPDPRLPYSHSGDRQ